MFDDLDQPKQATTQEEAHQILQELERSTSEEIRRKRSHFRLAIKSAVVLQSGNASELLSFKLKGATINVSEGGCSVLLPLPTHVGDIYRLQFDRGSLDLPLTFARCVRCRLVREDAYEAGFAFFKTITLPETLMSQTALDTHR
jgi:hypothetical protein